MRPIDDWFLKDEEPTRSCLQAMREHILGVGSNITERMHYGMPFFFYKGKRFCYLWIDRKRRVPYLGIVDGQRVHHPDLIQEGRAKMKIFLLDPGQDLPLSKIDGILRKAMGLVK